MNYDDISSLTLDLFDFLVDKLECDLDENYDFEALLNFLEKRLDDFITRDSNWN